MVYQAGQCWSYRVDPAFASSRLIIGAVASFESHDPIICCAVTDAPSKQPDGSLKTTTIPFLPMTLAAFEKTVIQQDGVGDVPASFAAGYDEWAKDSRGLTFFTVPFDGQLDRLIALQMAQIVGADKT